MWKITKLIVDINGRMPADFGKNAPWVCYVVFGPILAAQVAFAAYRNGLHWTLPLGVLLGLFLWTLDEYVMHRFSFHSKSDHPLIKPYNSGLHLLHHNAPTDVAYVAAPMVLCVPSYAILFGIFYLVAGFDLALNMGSGIIIGFLYYEWVHFATHHLPAKTPWMKVLKKQHMTHHFVDSDRYFGVTSTFWDHVFGTHGGAPGPARSAGKK